jgi:hypothetical protein
VRGLLLASAEPHSKGMAACVEEDVYTTVQAARILKVTDRLKAREQEDLERRMAELEDALRHQQERKRIRGY